MLKDLKFQVFFLILVVLFILSAISSAVNYKNLSQDFQTSHKNYEERISDGHSTKLINMLRGEYIVTVNSRPSPALLFSNYNSVPDRVRNQVIFFSPNFRKYGTTQSEGFSLNWYFILGILSGFIMLVLSFEAISAEKRAGTLRLLSIYGFKRQTILWYKYLCYMLLYLIIIIPPALVSMLLFFALSGTWSVAFMLKFLLIILLSIPFASFFVWVGILISMSKNYRNAIVTIIFVWLLFVIIIPQSANILAKQISPMKTDNEYSHMVGRAWNAEYDYWDEQTDGMVGSNGTIEDGVRANAVYKSDEKAGAISEILLDDAKRQVRIKQNIASLSPFAQFEKISEIIFDKGYYLLDFQIETLRRSISQIKDLMIKQDGRDENSLHLVYSWAATDGYGSNGKVAFSGEFFEQPDLLFVTEIPTDEGVEKVVKVLVRLLPILGLNVGLVVWCVVKLERLDIR